MRRWTTAAALAALLLAGCVEGGPAAPAPAAPAPPPAAAAPDTPAPPAATGGAAATRLAGVPVAAPAGYRVVPLPPEVTQQISGLEEAAGQQVADVEAAGITDESGNAAAVIVTRYAGLDVTSAEFEAQRRAQAASRGATLEPETIAGEPTLVSATPPLVSWTEGTDTLVVVSGNGRLDLDGLREVAAAVLDA